MIKDKEEIEKEINEIFKGITREFTRILFEISLHKYLVLRLIEVLKQINQEVKNG